MGGGDTETLFSVFIGTALVNNIVLAQFLGLCPFMGVSRRMDTAVGLSLATLVVLTLSSAIGHLLYQGVLLPLGLQYLRLITLIVTIAALVQAAELVIRRTLPDLQQKLGIYLPLITTNCAVLGIVLISTGNDSSLWQSILRALGAGLGFYLVMVLFTGLRDRLQTADVPKALQGVPIALFTVAILSLAFSGFTGIGR